MLDINAITQKSSCKDEINMTDIQG